MLFWPPPTVTGPGPYHNRLAEVKRITPVPATLISIAFHQRSFPDTLDGACSLSCITTGLLLARRSQQHHRSLPPGKTAEQEHLEQVQGSHLRVVRLRRSRQP